MRSPCDEGAPAVTREYIVSLSEERIRAAWEEMRIGEFELKALWMNVMNKVRLNCE